MVWFVLFILSSNFKSLPNDLIVFNLGPRKISTLKAILVVREIPQLIESTKLQLKDTRMN